MPKKLLSSRLLGRASGAFLLCACGANAAFATLPDDRVERLEVVRTDPATVRTPPGQAVLSRGEPRWSDFLATWGGGWRVRWNELTQTPHRVFGNGIDPEQIDAGARSGPFDAQGILGLSEKFVDANADLLGASWGDLRLAFVGFEGNRWVVTLQQEAQGLDVVGGRVDLRFSANGRLMLFGSDVYPVPDLRALPRIGMERALEAARQGLPAQAAALPRPTAPELVLLPMLAGEPLPAGVRKATPRLRVGPGDLRVRPAYKLHVRTTEPPGDWVSYVDAATGDLLWRSNAVRFAAVSGQVTADIHPNLGTDPLVTVPLPDTQVLGGAVAGTVVTYDFEASNQGWVGQVPWARSGESVHGGTRAWSDSPGVMYANNLDITLTSPTLNINAVVDPVLVFWTRLDLEDTWDFLYVEASGDNGTTWQTLGGLTGTVGWHQEMVDLSSVQGTTSLRLRFRLFTDPATTQDGCWVDDVSVASLGSGVSNAGGNYSLNTTGVSTTVTTSMRGRYVQVGNRAGGADAALSGTPAGGVLDFHWTSGTALASERDAYSAIQVVHARLKQIEPGFADLDFPLPVFVGVPNYCNGYYAGSQIVIGAGASGCADLGTWRPVLYHEYGHAITDHIYEPISDPPGDMHEALSDYLASTLTGDPRVGPDLQGPGSMFRTIENHLRYPEDYSGEVHIDGTILAGSLWDMRQLLLPDVDLADSLYHFARYGFPFSFEDYFLDVLTVDDNDGNLGNGTPHLQKIRSAFGFHGIGYGPEFEHVFVQVLNDGNGDGRLDPGEQADLRLTLRNYGVAETGVSARISTATPGVTVVQDSVFVGNVGAGAQVTVPASFHVQVDGSVAVGTAIDFDVDLLSSTGFDGDSFMLPVGYVPILLVDDDRFRTYDSFFGTAVTHAGKKWTRWNAGVLGSPSAEEMGTYRAVVWFTGNDRFNTLTPADQEELAAYLGGGGSLFLTGEDIDEDLWGGGAATAADKAFHENWLRAQVNRANEFLPITVTGQAGDVVGNGLSFGLNGGTGANNQDSPGSLLAVNGSVAAFFNNYGRIAGLRYTGAYRLLYLSFGFESITTAADRDTVMARALAWLCPSETQAPVVTLVQPNGGEHLAANANYIIRWSATDNIAVLSVNLLLSTNGGSNYSPIATGVPNSFAYNWTVPNVNTANCLVRVQAVDPSSNMGSDDSNGLFTITSLSSTEEGTLPRRYALHAPVPNPFNPRTRLRFDLPHPARVWLEIVDAGGRRVRTLLAGQTLAAGEVDRTWDGHDASGQAAPSGVYFVHLRANEFEATRKVQLLK